MLTIESITESLRVAPEVEALILVGSSAIGAEHAYSDVDLVIVLNENKFNVNSFYTLIEGKFADVFIFKQDDIKRISSEGRLTSNSFDAILVTWLSKSKVIFCKNQELDFAISKIISNPPEFFIDDYEKRAVAERINYSIKSVQRYLLAEDGLYRDALELRLLFCVNDAILGYFALRDVAWRGEKNAMQYLKNNDNPFYGLVMSYFNSKDLNERSDCFLKIARGALTNQFPEWDVDFLSIRAEGKTISDSTEIYKYIKNLFRQ